VTFWRKDKFINVAVIELEQRALVTILQDDDGVLWTVVTCIFITMRDRGGSSGLC
jgi:hypothetical protein